MRGVDARHFPLQTPDPGRQRVGIGGHFGPGQLDQGELDHQPLLAAFPQPDQRLAEHVDGPQHVGGR
jgi:hypothetical protein